MTINLNSKPIPAWSYIKSIIQDAADTERSWQAAHPNGDARVTPFMPFPLFDFIALMAEALEIGRAHV
jgi:hypothetical protein